MQPQPGRLQRRPAVVGQRTAHRRAVAQHDPRRLVVAPLNRALDRPDPAHRLLQFLLSVPVGLINRQRCLAQVVEVTQLVRHLGPDLGDREPDRRLAVADHTSDRDPDRGEVVGDLAQQTGEVGGRRGQQRAGQQDQSGQALADDP